MLDPVGLGVKGFVTAHQTLWQQADGHQRVDIRVDVALPEGIHIVVQSDGAVTVGERRHKRASRAPTTAWSVRWFAFSVSTWERSIRELASTMVLR
jgi:hypothetical protein